MLDLLPYLVCALIYIGLAGYYWKGRGHCEAPAGAGWRGLLPLLPLGGHAWLLLGDGIQFGFAASLSAIAALTVLFYSVAAWRFPLGCLRSLVLVFAGLMVGLQAVLPGARPLPEHWTPLFQVHILMAFAAYGLFSIAALHALLIAIAEKHLHKPVPPLLVANLPPLLSLESLLFRMLQMGFILLTLTLVSGVMFSEALYGHPFPLTHMTVFGMASWLIFAGLLAGRRIYGWRGRPALYWTLAGFVTLLLAYVGVLFVLEVILHRA